MLMIVVENMYPNGGMRDVMLMKKSCKYFNLFAKKISISNICCQIELMSNKFLHSETIQSLK